MISIESFSKLELRELLNKGWMTHDAMWFYHCLQSCGIEKTNEINRAAVKSMALIEVGRIKKALGMERVRSFDDLVRFAEGAYGFIKPDFMKFDYSFPTENVFHWEWEPGECFAYKGVKKLGLIDQYKCGIFLRPESWFDGMGLTYEVTPEVEGCMMHETGTCYRDYRFIFKHKEE